MKKVSIFGKSVKSRMLLLPALALVVGSASAQECTYSNLYDTYPGGWTIVNEGSKVPQGHNGKRGWGTFNGAQLNFTKIIGGGFDTRIYQNVETLSNNWECELDVTITAGSNFSAGAFSHVLLALTSSNQIPYQNWVFPYFSGSTPVTINHDAVGIQLFSSGQTHYFNVTSNDNGSITILCQIEIPYVLGQVPQTYHLVLQRHEQGTGRLEVSLLNGSFNESCCFDLPASIENLAYIQHANRPTAGYLRSFTGSIANTCIKDNYITAACDGAQSLAGIQTLEELDRADHELVLRELSDADLNLFPNPAIDHLNITFGDVESENVVIHIYDLQGRLLDAQRVQHSGDGATRVDVSSLQAGAYQLVVFTDNQEVIDSKTFFKR